MDEEIESILFICREVSVYKIPSLKKNEGHRAQDWGDLASPLWKGRLRILEKSAGAYIHFEDSQTGELFAKTEYTPDRIPVEAVLDSSRYFVIRIEDNGKKAYIGMGFAERTDSFDFNVALQDYAKRWRARMRPPSPLASTASAASEGPKKDYSLKEGQTFSISIPGRAVKSGGGLPGPAVSTPSGAVPLLPPPPSAPRRNG